MWKYIKLLGLWKDVRKVYAQENQGKDKPWYISRRFFGAVVVLIGGTLYTFLSITVPADMLYTMADNITTISTALKDVIPAAISLYGAITSIVGMVKKSKVEPK